MLNRAPEFPPALIRAATGRRKDASPAPSADRAVLHVFFNFLYLCGDPASVIAIDSYLMQSPVLSWRAAEEVEREVALVALRQSGRRVEALALEDLMQACEVVQSRHLIDNATIERHFRNMWQASSAYCRAYLRGLLALRPGEPGGGRGRVGAAALREGFSLTRMVLPPYRILQGSYRYAGRTWCSRNWGTPEDARLVSRQLEAAQVARAQVRYEFETVDGAPAGALRRLMERQPQLALACVSVDSDNGMRMLTFGGLQQPLEVAELPALDTQADAASHAADCRRIAQDRLQALLGTASGETSPPS